MKTNVTITLTIIAALLSGCSDDETTTNVFDRTSLLSTSVDELLLPAYTNFLTEATALQSELQAFTSNPDNTTLKAAKDAWIQTKLSWNRAEVFNFGPIADLALATSINLWPTTVNGTEQAIKDYDGSTDYLIKIGSNKKGLPAIEYLLFHENDEVIIDEFQNTSRKDYINLLIAKMVEQVTLIKNEWTLGYRDSFVDNQDSDSEGSITLLGNELISRIEFLMKVKVAGPLGLMNGGTPQPKRSEGYYSQLSLEMMQQNLIQLKKIFNGNEGLGFDDYLNTIGTNKDGEPLEAVINNQFDKVISKVKSINAPLQNAVVYQKMVVRQLYEELKVLTVLLKIDMASSISLLVVFSDCDGD